MNDARVSVRNAFAAAACATAAYIHFLIFAEFALLEIAAEVKAAARPENMDIAPLVMFGIAGAFASAAIVRVRRVKPLLATGFAVCAAASALAAATHSLVALSIAAALTGGGLGFTTATLAGKAHRLFAGRRVGLWLGSATGVAYAFCNLPLVFSTAPRTQAIIATVIAIAAAGVALLVDPSREPAAPKPASRSGFWSGVVVLFVLVWFDSAAFFLIQHDPGLKAASWGNNAQLWINVTGHLVAAILAGMLVNSGRIRTALALAGGMLGAAVLSLQAGGGTASLGHVLYPVAVSLYSVPLIVLPAMTRGVRSPSSSSMRAAILYAFSGWIASAAGIATALNLGRFAFGPALIAGAVLVVLLIWPKPWRAIAVAIALCSLAIPGRELRADNPMDPIAEGQRVYIAEGCIHCHSQFVRPGTRDELIWGPAAPLETLLSESPPLPGNRRQGPDLQNVGLRRSPEWNRLHLIDPRKITPGSRMPSYATLFDGDNRRGTALVAYLASLGADRWVGRTADIASWQPPRPASDTNRGRALFARFCAQCHGKDGRGDGPAASLLSTKPRDLTSGEWRTIPPGDDDALSRVIKFGIPGTSMAGHESLPDRDIAALTAFVVSRKLH